MEPKKITVLCVDDSPSVLDLLTYILNSDPQIEVIGTALTGKRALEFLEKKKPDLITMDMDMPEMTGLEATTVIMETDPVPIIIVSASWSPTEVSDTYKALDAGAVHIMEKPRGIGHPDHPKMAFELVRTVKTMSEVKLVTRSTRFSKKKEKDTDVPTLLKHKEPEINLIAIGSSTGGPLVLQSIFSNLPNDLPVPVVIVQHIAKGFVNGFKEWLSKSTGKKVQIATNLEKLFPGHSYIAPCGFQMGVTSQGEIALGNSEPINSLCPSVSYLFDSVAENYGENAVGILLTGMGKDGAKELKTMRDKGAITIAQDKESSVIYGMPGEAVKLGAAKLILSPARIAEVIIQLTIKETING